MAEVKETHVDKYQESSNNRQYAGMYPTAQDGVGPDIMASDNRYHLPVETCANQISYQVASNAQAEDSSNLRNQNMDTGDDNRWVQSRLPENITMQENDEESNHDKNQDESSYSRSIQQQQVPEKKKRGRKRKIREDFDASSESEPDLFNYDRFVKKVSK